MKKILLVLIALMGIGLSASAQSCEVGDDTYVAVQVTVNVSTIICKANCYGSNTPTSGTVYVTVYYINTNGEEDSQMITITWDKVNGKSLFHGDRNEWYGETSNAQRIKSWEVSAGACRIRRD